jgi:hypothetical protein
VTKQNDSNELNSPPLFPSLISSNCGKRRKEKKREDA